eukprot:CAMPEP_0197862470 /NCGR_PEP_ID=MMETSP1438-20131217/39256_1 /TAXON_ID=1461541 /ORGANISM="Pterosperma sp., Strain CCMP1384" /LENGTH=284 /DNA_ID=CAMNT_0043480039 /DNA_START=77 /DNA_END=931 /DNA_ORIENTATION=+
MRLITYESAGQLKVGADLGDEIVDLSAADSTIPTDMLSLLQGGEAVLAACKSAISKGVCRLPSSSVKIKAPIYNPEKVLCVGMNYVDHCTEQNIPVPTEPVIFNKFASCICAPGDDIIYTGTPTENLDFEVELVIVMGKDCKNVTKEDARAHIAGFTVAHDVSARDWQLKKNGGQWLIGKAMDTYAPIGPAIVTTDSIDPHVQGIRCKVNDQTVQDSNTEQMCFNCDEVVAWISRFMTLKTGDLILTGTPPGVGCFRKPPMWLKAGDVVTCEIDNIGSITNKVV